MTSLVELVYCGRAFPSIYGESIGGTCLAGTHYQRLTPTDDRLQNEFPAFMASSPINAVSKSDVTPVAEETLFVSI